MKTKLAIGLAALLSSSAMAHDNEQNRHHSYGNDSCNVNLEHSIKVSPQYVQVLDGQKSLFRITDDSQLFIDGDRVSLTPKQQELVEQYHALIQELAPQVTQLVSQALTLAREAITTLFNEMFGDDADMQQKVELITEKLEQRLVPLTNENQGEYFLSKDHIDAAGDDFGQEIEQEVEQLVKESAGEMLMFIGKMMLGDGELNGFEQRMEQFGEQMELKSKDIEQQANQMCQQIERLEALENELQQNIPKLANYDLIRVENI
jgi:phenylpyruvate tautomerase PptA (4-oxalocrotonate tautomerase family)